MHCLVLCLMIFLLNASYAQNSMSDFAAEVDSIIDFEPDQKINLDSPKRFLQISMLFILHQNSSLRDMNADKYQSDEEISNYMNAQRRNFYRNIGVTEEEYINYGLRHADSIQEYLYTDSDFASIYEKLQTQVID